MQLNIKRNLVTAGTGGIGKEIASQLAIEGVTVLINDRTEESVYKTLKEFKKEIQKPWHIVTVGLQEFYLDYANKRGWEKIGAKLKKI